MSPVEEPIMTGETAGLIAAGVAITGAVLGWFASLFGVGRKVGKLEADLLRCHERHDDHDERWIKIEQAVSDIRSLFYNVDGEARFLTPTAHDKLQRNCQQQMQMQIQHQAEAVASLRLEIRDLKAELLEAIRESR